MAYEKKSYIQVKKGHLKPLLLTSSGGGGHITAILGIHDFLSQKAKNIELPLYDPVLFEEKPESPLRKQIYFSISLLHAPAIGSSIQSFLSLTAFPSLPDRKNLDDEIYSLSEKEKGKQRPYIDMLLDVYPAGYEYAAIWNFFQRNDKITELKKLIHLQKRSDLENEEEVKKYFLQLLKEAAKSNSAYTEIICTQPMGLAGLCNAVLAYNSWLRENLHLDAPPIVIHQYLTDLPTKGAVHFFNALARLNREQQEQIILYAVGLEEEIIKYFFYNGAFFKGFFDIPHDKNPMIRSGLKKMRNRYTINHKRDYMLTLSGEPLAYMIKETEVIASVLLGSQTGKDSVVYVEKLLKNGIDRVFVFGGKTTFAQTAIQKLLTLHPEYKEKIIPLSYQGDLELAALMSRSNLIIIRGGGLCVMEQLAMAHTKEQTILVHHANGAKGALTSGISWEDNNVDYLISNLIMREIPVLKTTPERISRTILDSHLIRAISREECNVLPLHEIIRCVEQLSEEKLWFYLTELKKGGYDSYSLSSATLINCLIQGVEAVNS